MFKNMDHQIEEESQGENGDLELLKSEFMNAQAIYERLLAQEKNRSIQAEQKNSELTKEITKLKAVNQDLLERLLKEKNQVNEKMACFMAQNQLYEKQVVKAIQNEREMRSTIQKLETTLKILMDGHSRDLD